MLISYIRVFKGTFVLKRGFYGDSFDCHKSVFLIHRTVNQLNFPARHEKFSYTEPYFYPSPESGNAKTGYKDRNNKPITKWFVKYIVTFDDGIKIPLNYLGSNIFYLHHVGHPQSFMLVTLVKKS